jgi:predicted nuclease of predicted toxin-antitoxin system
MIMSWALANEFVVFTHDLGFSTTLALTHAHGPSVIQIRGRLVLPEDIGRMVIASLHKYEAALAKGALVVVSPAKARVRVLPLRGTH